MCWLSVLAMSTVQASLDEFFADAQNIFPAANRFSDFEGEPLVATVYQNQKVLGYLFRTKQLAPIPAYSGKPMDMLVGMDTEGVIVGVKVLEHHEPILLVGIPESRLTEFVQQYTGKSVSDKVKVGAGAREGYQNIDAITGATVTVMVMNEAMMQSAWQVAVAKGIVEERLEARQPPATVRKDVFVERDWTFLTNDGSIRFMKLNRGDVDHVFVGTDAEFVDRSANAEEAKETFINLYYTYLNAPTVGRNLLGDSQYDWLMSSLKENEHLIAIMGNGLYSFKGSGYVRGGIFDRILVRQNNREISFRDLDYHRLLDVYAKGVPKFSEMAIFVIRAERRFDPGTIWELELLVKRQTTPLESVFYSFSSTYSIPESYIDRPPRVLIEEPEAMWVQVWRERTLQISVLVGGLFLLTLILVFQDVLVKHPSLTNILRIGFQIYTLFFIGWYLLGQLSIVNVFTFTGAMASDFRWDTFLIDPTMFILWSFVAASLLFWGRGVYCGWLCPFGALQKLVNEIAVALHVRQFNLPQFIHDRLWGIKYLILMVLFGISLQSLQLAERYAEIEPFKTAVTLRFMREWGYVFYAAGLVLISVFNCKFYCKYICPLGAALAVPAKMRLVDWLRRRKECGSPCQTCARECEIQAIDERGVINPNECHYCLDCQVTYWDNRKCPPLVDKRKKRERVVAVKNKLK
ncbi:MAG: regulatory protein NosR [Gammaproteobacteria bacterium]|nr:regulatory protein NosR [Gammaproteobacteria bacterium]